jgi:hypothetical protein
VLKVKQNLPFHVVWRSEKNMTLVDHNTPIEKH